MRDGLLSKAYVAVTMGLVVALSLGMPLAAGADKGTPAPGPPAKQAEQLPAGAKEFEQEAQRRQRELGVRLSEMAQQAKQEGRAFTWAERRAFEMKHYDPLVYLDLTWYFDKLNEERKAAAWPGECAPDIGLLQEPSVSPGTSVVIWGTCFGPGPNPGEVTLKVSDSEEVKLDVDSWSEYRVRAVLPSIVGEADLPPYEGSLWLKTPSGVESNVVACHYEPLYSEWAAATEWKIGLWVRSKKGQTWLLGDGDGYGVALQGRTIPSEAKGFTIVNVEVDHQVDGETFLTSPHAGGKQMEQGYVIWLPKQASAGQASLEYFVSRLKYTIKGPKGMDPPEFTELGPWGFVRDVP